MRYVNLEALKEVYSVGSGDWSWDTERAEIEGRTPGKLDQLARNIRALGILHPILLGSDGRVWDGHHRIVVATMLGIESVPVAFSGEAE